MFGKISKVVLVGVFVLLEVATCSEPVSVNEIRIVNQKKLATNIVNFSSVNIGGICDDFKLAYEREKRTSASTLLCATEELIAEIKKGMKVLDKIYGELTSNSPGNGWPELLDELKAITEDGFFQTATIYARDITDPKYHSQVTELIQNMWQLLLQAREIATFKLSDTFGDTCILDELLLEISLAIDSAIKQGMVENVNDGAKAAQISFGLSAKLGNEESVSEILDNEGNEDLKSYFQEFFKNYSDDLKKLGVELLK